MGGQWGLAEGGDQRGKAGSAPLRCCHPLSRGFAGQPERFGGQPTAAQSAPRAACACFAASIPAAPLSACPVCAVQEPGSGQVEAAEPADDTTTRDSGGGGAVASAPAGGAATSAERPTAGAAGEAAGGEDDQLMQDVAALAGGAEGSDGIAQLEAALRPVERYAVRFVEREAPSVDKERLEAEVGAGACRGARRGPGPRDARLCCAH